MRKAGEVIESNVSKQTKFFAGRAINLSAIERACKFRSGTASRFFSGVRPVSVANARKIAAVLGMELGDFLEALDERVKIVQKANDALINNHLKRITEEDEADLRTIHAGKIPKPRMPGMRAL